MARKKIGFIDYFIDEWHANSYPQMIRDSALGDQFEVAMAYEQITPEGKTPLSEWCKTFDVAPASSIEQVVDACDVLLVLSPDNGEQHESLSDLPLKSGKPVYIDKPIALKADEAKRMYEKGDKHGSPVFSSSALRFGTSLQEAIAGPLAGKTVNFAQTTGPGLFHIYGVHQLEMIVAMMGSDARRIMHTGSDQVAHLTIDFDGERRASLTTLPGFGFTAAAYVGDDPGDGASAVVVNEMPDFFPRFIDAMLGFFDTGVSPVAVKETLAIAALIEKGVEAFGKRDQWITI